MTRKAVAQTIANLGGRVVPTNRSWFWFTRMGLANRIMRLAIKVLDWKAYR